MMPQSSHGESTPILPHDRYSYAASGGKIYFLDPERSGFTEADIYAGLRNGCRYNGQLDVKILTHLGLATILARAAGYDEIGIGQVAIHDAHEGLLGDMVAPLKSIFPEYERRVEIPWERRVHDFFGVPLPHDEPLFRAVRHIDRRCRVVEATGMRHAALREEFEGLYGGPATEKERETWTRVARTPLDVLWWEVVLHAARAARTRASEATPRLPR